VTRRAQSEAQIQRAVFDHIRTRGVPDAVAFHVGNGGYRRKIEAAILKGMGVTAGVPDVLIVCRGKLFCLELKAGNGRLSDVQRKMIDRLPIAGATVAVAYGLDEALEVLERWALLRGRAALRPEMAKI
jgi:hypothetical protein